MTKHQNLTPEAFARRLPAAQENLSRAAAALAAAATDGQRSDDLWDRLVAVAKAEVDFTRENLAARIAERRGVAPAEALRLTAIDGMDDLLFQGADDTWSGRGNDLRRVRHDALRRWVACNIDLGDD